MRCRVRTYNQLAVEGLPAFSGSSYEVKHGLANPDIILCRSHSFSSDDLGTNLSAVIRAGAGINNIPVDVCTQRGIPVMNTPGANANAVKELVLCGMLLAARNVCAAWSCVQQMNVAADDFAVAVEGVKKQFVGAELPGKTLLIVGLGQIGVLLANAACALGMRVLGYDPYMSLEHAWQLNALVEKVDVLTAGIEQADFISLHVPLSAATEAMVDAKLLQSCQPHACLLNFARAPIVAEEALQAALSANALAAYVTDFPSAALCDHPRVIALPHLGASTAEAEGRCAHMAVEQLTAYWQYGSIRHAVNFPDVQLPYRGGVRLAVAHENTPGMVAKISTLLSGFGCNILDMLNRSKKNLAYTVLDVSIKKDNNESAQELSQMLAGIQGVCSCRLVRV